MLQQPPDPPQHILPPPPGAMFPGRPVQRGARVAAGEIRAVLERQRVDVGAVVKEEPHHGLAVGVVGDGRRGVVQRVALREEGAVGEERRDVVRRAGDGEV